MDAGATSSSPIAGVSGYTPPNQGNGGDNDPATTVRLDQPYGVTADNEGNVYIAEYNGGRIRKVDTNGIITTVSSAFQSMPYALATDAIGNVYLAEGAQSRPNYIRKIVFPALYADHA